MKIRVSATALFLSLALPAVLTEAHLGSAPLAESAALADGSDQVTDVARQRFAEGVKAFDAGHFEDARSAFLQAYALKRNPVLLLNLGQAELKAKHPDEAGNHLQQFLREVPNVSAEDRSSAEKGIAEAKKKAAFIVVSVDANQADVSIDGALVGKAPLADPVFVKPGKHTVLASYSGKEGVATVDAKVGSAAAANVTVGSSGASAAAAAPPPAPTPKAPVAAAPPAAPAATPAEAAPAPADPAPKPAEAAPPPPPEAADTSNGEHEFFDWYKHKPVAWVGTGVAVAGAALGIIFAVSANSASTSETSESDQIKAHAAKDARTNFGALKPCGSQTQSGNDIVGYAAACDGLRSSISAHNTDQILEITGFALLGVGVVGTAMYAIIDRHQKAPTTGQASPTWRAVPVVSANQQGISILGSF